MTGRCPACGWPSTRLPDRFGGGVPLCRGCLAERIVRAAAGERLAFNVETDDTGGQTDRPGWLAEESANEIAVHEHLKATALLSVDDFDLAARARRNTERMLAEVRPGRKVCCYVPTWKAQEDRPAPRPCSNPGVRMIAITGDFFCEAHDPNGPGRAPSVPLRRT